MNNGKIEPESEGVKPPFMSKRCKVPGCVSFAGGLDLCVLHARLAGVRPGYSIEMRRNGKLAVESLPEGISLRLAMKAFAAGVDEMKRRGTVYDWLALVETSVDGHRNIINAVNRGEKK